MSLITPEQMNMGWPQALVDQRVNQFPISEIEFAKISSLYHRYFGVWTGSHEGELTWNDDKTVANRSEHKDQFLLTPCVRDAYPRIADGIFAELENFVGYNLTERYVTEEVEFTSSFVNYQTLFAGIEKLDVRQMWHPIAGLEEVELSYLVQYPLTVEDYSLMDTTKVALISDRLFQNPNEVWLREANSMTYYPWFFDNEHPLKRGLSSHTWKLPLAENIRTYTTPLGAQDRRYVTVEIEAPTLPAGAVLYPVYPGSNQIIKEAKPRELIEDGKIRFWLYLATLVHPDFRAEHIDLVANDFYKMYPAIAFKYVIEEEALPLITYTYGDQVRTITPRPTLTSSEYGLVHLNFDYCQRDWECLCAEAPRSVWVRYFYKTNPRLLPSDQRDYIIRLKEAASRRIAAELPTVNCGCVVERGFIPENQMPYPTRYAVGGALTDKMRYGDLHGQLFYADTLNNAPTKTKMTEAY